MACPPHGCQIGVSQQGFEGGGLCTAATQFHRR
uniref:Uncharacterized protein n=1 Tax=Arundo donax TaxID=35708 RepID=A0A0A8YZL8_ARUDO